MLHTDNINYIELNLLESQIDLVLDALQVYAFNLHHGFFIHMNKYKVNIIHVDILIKITIYVY